MAKQIGIKEKEEKYVLFSITINDTIIDNVYNCYMYWYAVD